MYSFSYRGKDLAAYGVALEHYTRPLLPAARASFAEVLGRPGSVDVSAFPDRSSITIQVDCGYAADSMEQLRRDARELAYLFSKPGELTFSDEPGKYYKARAVEEIPLDNDLTVGHFTVYFHCEPFAYASPKTQALREGPNRVEYQGTAPAPCTIVIRNPNDYPVSKIQITAVYRR